MSNASTIRRQVSGSIQLTTAPIVNPGTTVTQFQLNNNALTLTGGGVIPLSAGVTGLYQGTGQVLHIRAAGSFSGVTGGTTTIALTLFEVPAAIIAAGGLTSTSSTGYNTVASTGASAAVVNAAGAFTLDAFLQLDAAGNLNGNFSAQIDDATTIALQKISSVQALLGEQDLNFVLAVTLGGAEPSTSTLVLNEFGIDLL
jgi:hypothetical protein